MTRPKSSVLGKDKDVLPLLFQVHAPNAIDILDCTHNKGVMWKGLDYKIITMDIDSQHKPDVVGDFTNMPFKNNCFDVLVFDPPHLPNAGHSQLSSLSWDNRYGITDNGRDGDNVSNMFLPFFKEAKRVLKQNGVVFAKIADLVHNHRYQWQHIDLIVAAQQTGMTACDMIIKIDPNAGSLLSSKWTNIKHFRKNHCFWIVIRNGNKCEL